MLEKILSDLELYNARLVAVSKTRSNQAILAIYDKGHRVFGENRVQELASKYEVLPKDIQWHMIGHLQSKKVKLIAPFVSCIHSIDSQKLLEIIDKEAAKNNRVIDVLLQFKIADEESKYGFDLETIEQLLKSSEYREMKNIRICGVMGMATFTDDENQVRIEFKALKKIFDHLSENYFSDQTDFKEISMGMSGDYQIALEEGSTIVRVGSLLFN